MGRTLERIISPNPELTPSPFPNWSRPRRFLPPNKTPQLMRKNFFNVYWSARISKEKLRSATYHFIRMDIADMTKYAVNESRNGMWKVASHTFEEAILQVQKLAQSKSLTVPERDSLWIDISIRLREAGFYGQARHVLKNMNSSFYICVEEKILDIFIENERNSQKQKI